MIGKPTTIHSLLDLDQLVAPSQPSFTVSETVKCNRCFTPATPDTVCPTPLPLNINSTIAARATPKLRRRTRRSGTTAARWAPQMGALRRVAVWQAAKRQLRWMGEAPPAEMASATCRHRPTELWLGPNLRENEQLFIFVLFPPAAGCNSPI